MTNLATTIEAMKAQQKEAQAMLDAIKARVFNIFTAKGLVKLCATIAALQVPWGLLVDNKQAILAGLATVKEAAATGDKIRLAIAILGVGATITDVLRAHPQTPAA